MSEASESNKRGVKSSHADGMALWGRWIFDRGSVHSGGSAEMVLCWFGEQDGLDHAMGYDYIGNALLYKL